MWHLFIHIHHLKVHELSKKHPQNIFLDPRKTLEKKFQTHKIPIRKNFGPIKCPRKKNYIYEITTRKNIGPSNYRREDILDPRNTHEKNVRIHEARWHETHDCKGPREFSTLRLIDG